MGQRLSITYRCQVSIQTADRTTFNSESLCFVGRIKNALTDFFSAQKKSAKHRQKLFRDIVQICVKISCFYPFCKNLDTFSFHRSFGVSLAPL